MRRQPTWRVWGITLVVGLCPAAVRAQAAPDMPGPLASRALSVGAGVSAIFTPRDDTGFFNYTDYDRNALRVARIRLFGEWRVLASVSFVGEVRAETESGADVAGFYVRWRPWAHGHLDVQAGRIPPVFGGFGRRAYDRDNIVLGTPLAYQYVTSLRPDALPATVADLLRMRGRGWRPSYPIGSADVRTGVPLVAASRWDTGVEARWQDGRVEVAGAWTRGAPAVPVVRETNDRGEWSGRVAITTPWDFTVAASAARGPWIEEDVLRLLLPEYRRKTSQTVIGADMEYGRGPWLVRGEWMHSDFDVPIVSEPPPAAHLSAWSGFVESRYRVRPRWDLAARVERLAFGTIANPSANGAPTPWEFAVGRLEATLAYRVTRQFEVRGGWQQNWRAGGRVTHAGFPAVALFYWF